MSDENKKEKGNTLKIIIIVLLLVIAIGGGAFAGYLIFGKQSAQTGNVPNNVNNQNVIVSKGVVSEYTYDLSDFFVNLSDEDGKRYLKAKVFLGYEKKNLSKELDSKKAILRDAINYVLRSKKSNDFTQKGLDNLKKEILDKINPMFEESRPDNVYFYDILIQ